MMILPSGKRAQTPCSQHSRYGGLAKKLYIATIHQRGLIMFWKFLAIFLFAFAGIVFATLLVDAA
jgi:hypothetical protein